MNTDGENGSFSKLQPLLHIYWSDPCNALGCPLEVKPPVVKDPEMFEE
jgi:hypothetical protein